MVEEAGNEHSLEMVGWEEIRVCLKGNGDVGGGSEKVWVWPLLVEQHLLGSEHHSDV